MSVLRWLVMQNMTGQEHPEENWIDTSDLTEKPRPVWKLHHAVSAKGSETLHFFDCADAADGVTSCINRNSPHSWSVLINPSSGDCDARRAFKEKRSALVSAGFELHHFVLIDDLWYNFFHKALR